MGRLVKKAGVLASVVMEISFAGVSGAITYYAMFVDDI
jgi:hypothetical protein